MNNLPVDLTENITLPSSSFNQEEERLIAKVMSLLQAIKPEMRKIFLQGAIDALKGCHDESDKSSSDADDEGSCPENERRISRKRPRSESPQVPRKISKRAGLPGTDLQLGNEPMWEEMLMMVRTLFFSSIH